MNPECFNYSQFLCPPAFSNPLFQPFLVMLAYWSLCNYPATFYSLACRDEVFILIICVLFLRPRALHRIMLHSSYSTVSYSMMPLVALGVKLSCRCVFYYLLLQHDLFLIPTVRNKSEKIAWPFQIHYHRRVNSYRPDYIGKKEIFINLRMTFGKIQTLRKIWNYRTT